MNYYYFGASLPGLRMETEPPMSYRAFRAECRRFLHSRDLEGLDALDGSLAEPSAHPFVAAWRCAETRLRNAVARQRCAARKEDAGPHMREVPGIDLRVERTVSDAFGEADPLRRQRRLDEFRWKVLEELAGPTVFTGDAILAYGLKLQLKPVNA